MNKKFSLLTVLLLVFVVFAPVILTGGNGIRRQP
jgi:hypothetical protein